MRIAIPACIILAALVLLPIAATAQPIITIYTDTDSYAAGETIEVSLAAQNIGEATSVDVYIGVIMPSGRVLSYNDEGWTDSMQPWARDVFIPSPSSMLPMPMLWFEVPSGVEGEFQFAAGLTYPGTTDFASEISLASFTIGSPTGSHYYVNAETGDDGNDGSEAFPWRTITHALNSVEGSSSDPVTIHVAAGTYSTSENGETFPLNMKSWVSLSGVDRDTTILDAEGEAHRVILCNSVNDLTIEGLAITGGQAIGDSFVEERGGGIFCDSSSPTISDNKIEGNSAFYGGGIASENSSLTISNNTIGVNSAMDNGGGIFCSGDSLTISNNKIRDNSAISGGGIYCYSGSPTISSNSMTRNSANVKGGGIYCHYYSSPVIVDNLIAHSSAVRGAGLFWADSSTTVAGNVIVFNSAAYYGGGIYCCESSTNSESSATIENNMIKGNSAAGGGGIVCCHSSLAITNNTIRDNSAVSGGGLWCVDNCFPKIADNTITENSAQEGGGIYCSESSPIISSNMITSNWGRYGGGIFCLESLPIISCNTITGNSGQEGGGICCDYYSSPKISNNTIADNSAEDGGGIYCYFSCSPVIADCILWGNGDDLYDCSVMFCCIKDDDAGVGNIHDDPMFVIGPFGDYYLHADSPCIDAGRQSAADAGLDNMTTQADGTPDTGTVDMGCHYPIPEVDRGRSD